VNANPFIWGQVATNVLTYNNLISHSVNMCGHTLTELAISYKSIGKPNLAPARG
jgi:hypothetical protein